jgi:hypothetical protein
MGNIKNARQRAKKPPAAKKTDSPLPHHPGDSDYYSSEPNKSPDDEHDELDSADEEPTKKPGKVPKRKRKAVDEDSDSVPPAQTPQSSSLSVRSRTLQ